MYIHHRLLKLHRLYMPRAYQGTDPKYHNSREVCLESADVILSCYNELVQADSPLHRWWSFRMWLFDAVSTLQIDLLYRIAQPLDSNLIRRQADVEQGINLLQPHTTLEKSNKFLPAAISALRALQREEKLKRIAYKRKAETEAMASKEDGRSKHTRCRQIWSRVLGLGPRQRSRHNHEPLLQTDPRSTSQRRKHLLRSGCSSDCRHTQPPSNEGRRGKQTGNKMPRPGSR